MKYKGLQPNGINVTEKDKVELYVSASSVLIADPTLLQTKTDLYISGSLEARDGLIGDITGTGSWAINATTASYVQFGSVENLTAFSSSVTEDLTNIKTVTASLQSSVASLNIATGSLNSRVSSLEQASGSIRTAFNLFTGSYNTGSFTGSFKGDGSLLTGIVAEAGVNIQDSGSALGIVTTFNFVDGTDVSVNGNTVNISPVPFPYTGSAEILGTLSVNGNVTASRINVLDSVKSPAPTGLTYPEAVSFQDGYKISDGNDTFYRVYQSYDFNDSGTEADITSYISDFNTGGGLGYTTVLPFAYQIISALKYQPDGKLLVAGNILSYSGSVVDNVIRINTDGTLDTTFNSGIDSRSTDKEIRDIKVQNDGKILVCGNYTVFSGSTVVDRITRLNPDGTIDSTFNVNGGATGIVNSIAIQSDGKIVIGGSFTSYSGSSRNRLVRTEISGAIDTTFNIGTGFNQEVLSTAIQADGKIIVGGRFDTYSGSTFQRLVRLNTDGTTDTAALDTTGLYLGDANNGVHSIFIQNDQKILVALSGFSSGKLIRRYNTDGTLDTSFNNNIGSFGTYSYHLANSFFRNNYGEILGVANLGASSVRQLSTGKILLTGNFTRYSGSFCPGIVLLNEDGTWDRNFQASELNGVDLPALVTDEFTDGKIAIGGAFSVIKNTVSRGIAVITGSGEFINERYSIVSKFKPLQSKTSSTGLNLENIPGLVWKIKRAPSGKIYVGGLFSTYGDTSVDDFIELNSDGTFSKNFTHTGVEDFDFLPNGNIVAVGSNASLIRMYDSEGNILRSTTSLSNKDSIALLPNNSFAVGSNSNLFGGTGSGIEYRNNVIVLNEDFSWNRTYKGIYGASSISVTGPKVASTSNGKLLVAPNIQGTVYTDYFYHGIGRTDLNGTLDLTFNPGIGINSTTSLTPIHRQVLQQDGKIVVGGQISQYSGSTANGIVRINSNGTRDTTFNPGTVGIVRAINLLSDGKFIIGGDFTSYSGSSINRLVRANSNGTRDTSFNVGTGANGNVNDSVVQSDGKIIIVGEFTTYSGSTLNRLARLNDNGTIDTTFNIGTGFSLGVDTVALQPDGKILVGSDFTSYSGSSKNDSITRINTDGTEDTTFNARFIGSNNLVYDIHIQDSGKILVGGDLTSYQYTGSSNFFSSFVTSSSTVNILQTTAPSTNGPVTSSLLLPDNKLVLAGSFTQYSGSSAIRLVRINTDKSLDDTFNTGTGPNGDVRALAVQSDGKLLIGGNFTEYSGSAINRIARINTDGTLDSSFDIGTGANAFVWSIDLDSTEKIVIGGDFTNYSGSTVGRIVRLTNSGSLDPTFSPGTAGSTVRKVKVQSDDKILIGGDFTSYSGSFNQDRILRINTNGTVDGTFNGGGSSGAGGSVNEIEIQSDGKIIIGGAFGNYNGTSISGARLVRLDQNGFTDFTFTRESTNEVLDVVLQNDGSVLVGTIASLGIVNSGSTSLSPFSVNTNGPTSTIVPDFNGELFIGGNIPAITVTVPNLVRLKDNGYLDETFDYSGTILNRVLCITSSNDNIFYGFGTNSGIPSVSGLKILNTSGSEIREIPVGGGGVTQILMDNSNNLMLSGPFTAIGGTRLPSGVNRINSDGTLDTTFSSGNITDTSNNPIWHMSEQTDGKILVAGEFHSYSGSTLSSLSASNGWKIARLNTNGTLDSTFNPGRIGQASTVGGESAFEIHQQSDGKILVGGEFKVASGSFNAVNLVRFNESGSIDTTLSTNPGVEGAFITALETTPEGDILIGGLFSSIKTRLVSNIGVYNSEPIFTKNIQINPSKKYIIKNVAKGYVYGTLEPIEFESNLRIFDGSIISQSTSITGTYTDYSVNYSLSGVDLQIELSNIKASKINYTIDIIELGN